MQSQYSVYYQSIHRDQSYTAWSDDGSGTAELKSDSDDESEDTQFLSSDSSPTSGDELDFGGYESTVSVTNAGDGIVGLWSGYYYYHSDMECEGLMSFSIISEDPDGFISGSGADAIGDFAIVGSAQSSDIIFTKRYVQLQQGVSVSWRYTGALDYNSETISGVWGPADPTIYGSGPFTIRRRPPAYFIFRPSEEDFQLSKPRAHWKFARNAVLHQVRSHILRWESLLERREQRRRFVRLYIDSLIGSTGDKELKAMSKTIAPEDLRYYRSLGDFYMRREIIYG